MQCHEPDCKEIRAMSLTPHRLLGYEGFFYIQLWLCNNLLLHALCKCDLGFCNTTSYYLNCIFLTEHGTLISKSNQKPCRQNHVMHLPLWDANITKAAANICVDSYQMGSYPK